MLKIVLFLLALQFQSFPQSTDIVIFLIGNSTMADKPYKDGNPEKGWGQLLPLYFKQGVKIENHAKNGRSTKSFIVEGRWDSVVNRIKHGDYVIIEFGHNDAKKDDPKRFADAHTDYRNNLIKFIDETRSKGGVPILATPIVRRRFNKEGIFYDVHADYPIVVRELAEEKNTILFDLHKSTEELVTQFGMEKSKQLYLHIGQGEYKSLPDGLKDDTHFSAIGAFKICDFAIHEIKEKVKALEPFIKE